MSIFPPVIRLAARAVANRYNVNNKAKYRWLIRQYEQHVLVKRNGIVHYERLFEAMQIVPADFLHIKCHTPATGIVHYERLFEAMQIVPADFLHIKCHTPATKLNLDWLHEPYKIETRPFMPLFSFCDSRRSITFTSWTIEHYVKHNALFTEQEMYEWMMDYLLAIKY